MKLFGVYGLQALWQLWRWRILQRHTAMSVFLMMQSPLRLDGSICSVRRFRRKCMTPFVFYPRPFATGVCWGLHVHPTFFFDRFGAGSGFCSGFCSGFWLWFLASVPAPVSTPIATPVQLLFLFLFLSWFLYRLQSCQTQVQALCSRSLSNSSSRQVPASGSVPVPVLHGSGSYAKSCI